MDEVIIIGHKNPDLDSVASALAFAYFRNETGEKGWSARRAGDADDETEFIFKKFNVELPPIIKSLKGKKVALVDHSAYTQMLDDMKEAEIVEVVDHHNVGDLQTNKPIRFHSEPVGSTCTIIASYFLAHNIKIPKDIASILLAGIISDTDLFKSPTTTKLDLQIKALLEDITKIDSSKLGIEMFKVKSNIEKKTMHEIINEDAKEYDLPLAIKLYCSQVKLMDLNGFITKRKDELLKTMNADMKKGNYDLFVVIVTDLIKEGSEVFAAGKTDIFEKAMNVKLKDSSVYIDGLMSRKSQVIPLLIGLK